MTVQILVLALAFYLGYRYALTKVAPRIDAQQPAAPDTANRKPKKGKAKKQQKQTQQQKPTDPLSSKPKQQVDQQPSEKQTDQTSIEKQSLPSKSKQQVDQQPSEKQMGQRSIEKQPLLVPKEKTKEPASPPTRSPASPDEWETVRRTDSAQTPQRASAAIPVHQTRWANLDIDENLDHSLNPKAAQPRVLRIGAPAGPPPRALPRIRYDPPEPQKLTKKQRQTQRQMQKRREEQAQATAIQEQRLREHRKQLEDTRSREQWEKAKRAKARKLQQQGGAPKGSGPLCIDGKLIWD